MTHTGEKAHKCNQCLPCAHAPSFKIKMRMHMGEKSYKCSQCDYTCTRVANLHTHMLTHTEVRAFNCDQCTGWFFNCSAKISVLKRKTLFNQRGSLVHRKFHGTEPLIIFHFGTENWEEQFKKSPCIIFTFFLFKFSLKFLFKKQGKEQKDQQKNKNIIYIIGSR